MNFTRYDESPELSAFRDEVTAFLDRELTDRVVEEAAATRDEHHPVFFAALGARGWLIPDAPVSEGGAGLTYEQIEILDAELTRRSAPVINHSTSRLVFPAIRHYASEEIRETVMREVASGLSALTLGYTEPSGGSDIAQVKTRAVQQANGDWVINGAKVYTTGAHHARYCFLLTNTDPSARRGAGLTMFLMPLDLDGVEIRAIETLGERTNSVFFGDVRLGDKFRLGEVNDGWAVLQGPLEAEHGVGNDGSCRAHLDLGALHARRLAVALQTALDALAEAPRGVREDPTVLRGLGEVLLSVESGMSADRLEGRVNSAERYIQGTSSLVELFAPDSLVADGHRFGRLVEQHLAAQVSSIYGGTTEVFRNLIVKQLGLPRQAYKQ